MCVLDASIVCLFMTFLLNDFRTVWYLEFFFVLDMNNRYFSHFTKITGLNLILFYIYFFFFRNT